MSRLRWFCAHLPLAIAEAIALDEEERAIPIEWVTEHAVTFPEVMPPSCEW